MNMPSVVVLVVCKTVLVGEADDNSKYTGWQNREWDYTHSVMHCRREVIELMDGAEAQGADPQPFTTQRCQRSGLMLGAEWDASHRNSNYRVFRVACPTPIRSGKKDTDPIIGYQIPDCGRVDGVQIVCEKDSVI